MKNIVEPGKLHIIGAKTAKLGKHWVKIEKLYFYRHNWENENKSEKKFAKLLIIKPKKKKEKVLKQSESRKRT